MLFYQTDCFETNRNTPKKSQFLEVQEVCKCRKLCFTNQTLIRDVNKARASNVLILFYTQRVHKDTVHITDTERHKCHRRT
jgi:hypothetical protein